MIGFVPPDHTMGKTAINDICENCLGIEKRGIEFKNPSRLKQLYNFFESFTKGVPFRVWQWHDQHYMAAARRLIEQHSYDAIHFSGIPSGLVFSEVLKMECKAKLVFDLIDSVALSIESSLKAEPLLWPFRLVEKKRLKRYEQAVIEQADEAVLISERDRNYLESSQPVIIPNGVSVPELKKTERDIDLLFTGNMAAEPNIDAVQWFAEEVMPLIPSLKLTIAGAHPADSVRRLAGDNITITGYVEDLNAYYRRARLFVCPMRLGAGQKNKMLEAMINKTPVVSTGEGNIGIDAPGDAIALADDPKAFAEAIEQLWNDPTRRKTLAENGYRYVKNNFSWQNSAGLLAQQYA